MRTKNRWRFGAVIAGVCALAVATPALADVTTQHFATASRSSDPFIFDCGIPVAPYKGKCMVTSQDLQQAPIGTIGQDSYNPYPMDKTLGYYSVDGKKWTSVGTVVTEAKIGRANVKHLWAPAVSYWYNGSGPVIPEEYYLYTPDVEDVNNTLTSRIYVTYSTNFASGFGNTDIPGLPAGTKYRELTGPPTSGSEHDNLYMSDPEVFSDVSVSRKNFDHSKDYLLWADGDGSTCGSLSLRRMTGPTSVQPFAQRSDAYLTINDLMTGNGVDGGVSGAAPPNGATPGDQGLGTCEKKKRGTGTIYRPYIEGGSLFRSDHWTFSSRGRPGTYVMIFAAKPSETPGVCKGEGQPSTANEVIAYATASTVTGPYTYKGIIMCGSADARGSGGEWTNQATLQELEVVGGTKRLVITYHDAPNNRPAAEGQSRDLHSECLFTYNGQFVLTTRSADGAVDVNGNNSWCLKYPTIRAIKSVRTGEWVWTDTGELRATGDSIIPGAQFALIDAGGGQWYLRARTPDLHVSQASAGNKIYANSGPAGSQQKITLVQTQPGSSIYRIQGANGLFWQTQADGSIKAGSNNPAANDTSYHFDLAALTQ